MQQQRMVLDLFSEMQKRVSTKPLDKVAGLVYLFQTDSIPIYDVEQSAADAWEVLVDVMGPEFRAQLFFFYPFFWRWKEKLATIMEANNDGQN